ncbi:conserved Plasmodium protein, unknown function [Plasmodium gallinaceum]|uniref:Uncharacterized protein n=1 Tax=Plasmodium gallinaceum TaxID=5849 RepID=A0A1J1GLM2_PLAGA|nr:conserved Plasmodium protein, unknown function [Plasmodium gallinaceum]CRG93310.1 conserved Plasmodium protein, unknown function [Plasmodium gallinaceum]
MAISLCKILRRNNKRVHYEKGKYIIPKLDTTLDTKFDESGEENIFDPPLKAKDDLPLYMQPSENNKSWSEEWRDKGLKKEENKKHNFLSSDNYAYNVPYNYKIVIPTKKNVKDDKNIKEEYSRDVSDTLSYTDFCGFRNPSLSTFDNYRYWQDSGFKKFLNRIFPIKIPEHKKVDPLLREYIYFLHSFDPYRFTFKKLSGRYFFPESTIKLIYKEESVKRFLAENQLCDEKTKRITKKEAILKIKELIYSKKIGYKEIGDYENIKNEDDEFVGYKNTFDQINRQVIQVESISSFPLPDRRDPVPKRVDIDMPVFNSANVKIMNWINPNDKVIF